MAFAAGETYDSIQRADNADDIFTSMAIRWIRTIAVWLTVLAIDPVVARLAGQTVDSGFVYGGVTFGKRLEGAGRFGAGLDFHLAERIDLGGEIGTIHKKDVGVLASANLTYHFNRPRRRGEDWD